MFKQLTLAGTCLCFTLSIAGTTHAAGHHSSGADRPDDHAPIGVMRDHVHGADEWMFSYRYGYMHMDGNRNGTSSVSTQQVLNNFMVAPTEMPMQMHMLGGMYGVTDQWTLSVMGGFAEKKMDNQRRNGSTFEMESEGFTDTSINALYEFYNDGTHRLQWNTGLSLPTGSITERNAAGAILGYPMQIGSGTYDFLPGISYSGFGEDWSWGGQLNSVIRLGKNNRGYSLGNRYQATSWIARKLSDAFSASFRFDAHAWDSIDGQDRDITVFMAPPLNPNRQAGERVDALVGVNFIVPDGNLQGNRLALEFGMPVYERLDGPRLETDYRLTLGWQKAF